MGRRGEVVGGGRSRVVGGIEEACLMRGSEGRLEHCVTTGRLHDDLMD
jgi:hypothetical protein